MLGLYRVSCCRWQTLAKIEFLANFWAPSLINVHLMIRIISTVGRIIPATSNLACKLVMWCNCTGMNIHPSTLPFWKWLNVIVNDEIELHICKIHQRWCAALFEESTYWLFCNWHEMYRAIGEVYLWFNLQLPVWAYLPRLSWLHLLLILYFLIPLVDQQLSMNINLDHPAAVLPSSVDWPNGLVRPGLDTKLNSWI